MCKKPVKSGKKYAGTLWTAIGDLHRQSREKEREREGQRGFVFNQGTRYYKKLPGTR